MATIALYAGKINQMPSLIGKVRKSVDNYSAELFSLKSKALNIRKTVCDLDDVIGMIQASTEIQEQKAESLEAFRRKTEEFAADAVRIDEDAAAVINQSKEDFYNKYNYLKPDAEKNFLEEWFDNAAEWCAEHWQEIAATAAIIVGAALAIAAVVATGGAALVPLLTSLLTAVGVSAGTAVTAATIISFTVAVIAVVSTVGSSALNIADTWGNFDNPVFNTLQSVLNWSSMISNGLYSVGSIYNGIKGIQNGALREYSKSWRKNPDFKSAVSGADKFPFSVQRDKSTFWAGLGKDGQYAAKDEAARFGRTTLESTIESQNIVTPVGDPAWDSASASYAMRSSGRVMTVMNKDVLGTISPKGRVIGRTWLTIEKVLLNVNPHVTGIDGAMRTLTIRTLLSGGGSGWGAAASYRSLAEN